MDETVTKEKVKAANIDFYNAAADSYESIDGRRSRELEEWLRRKLVDIRRNAPGGRLLDLGTGSGFVTRCARGIFEERTGLDSSAKILEAHKDNFDKGVCADLDSLPFPDNSFDVITAFAVLHHLHGFGPMISEVARVLKPGGIFYSDHDMDYRFRRNFAVPIALFRKLKDRETRKKLSEIKVSYDMYALSEYHSSGVPSDEIASLLAESGFTVKVTYHWFGVFAATNRILKDTAFPKGCAPLMSITAVRK